MVRHYPHLWLKSLETNYRVVLKREEKKPLKIIDYYFLGYDLIIILP